MPDLNLSFVSCTPGPQKDILKRITPNFILMGTGSPVYNTRNPAACSVWILHLVRYSLNILKLSHFNDPGWSYKIQKHKPLHKVET